MTHDVLLKLIFQFVDWSAGVSSTADRRLYFRNLTNSFIQSCKCFHLKDFIFVLLFCDFYAPGNLRWTEEGCKRFEKSDSFLEVDMTFSQIKNSSNYIIKSFRRSTDSAFWGEYLINQRKNILSVKNKLLRW